MGALKVWDGFVWQTIGDNADVYVNASAPPGPLTSGDLWWDTDETTGSLTTLPIGIPDGGTGGTSAPAARSSLSVPFVGNSSSVAGGPTTGTYARGDHWLDVNNRLWVCSVAGSPGTWVLVPGGGNSTSTAGAPATGTWTRGDLWVDSSNVTWTCVTSGTPGTWVPPTGYEYAFNQSTTQVNLTSTNPASPHLIIEGTSRSYDGTPILVEFYAGTVQAPSANGQATVVSLWDASTDLGMIGELWNVANFGVTMCARRKITPSAGTHNYRIQAWVNAGTGGVVYAGSGGAGATQPPTYIRVTKA